MFSSGPPQTIVLNGDPTEATAFERVGGGVSTQDALYEGWLDEREASRVEGCRSIASAITREPQGSAGEVGVHMSGMARRGRLAFRGLPKAVHFSPVP